MRYAYREAQAHGIGEAGSLLRWYRIIEAEALTSEISRVESITTWLSVEYVPDEILDLRDGIIDRILTACNEVATRLAWRHSEPTRVTLLSLKTEAPWASSPYGYCVSKEPYEKICLPSYLVDDEDEFAQAVAHEYAHVVSISLADGYAPRWLEEAISVLIERRFDAEIWRDFKENGRKWRSPGELETVLESRPPENESTDMEIWAAYQQSGWIGRYLASLRTEQKLSTMLREIANEDVWRNLSLSFLGQDRVDGALKHTYGKTTADIFSEARIWLATQSI